MNLEAMILAVVGAMIASAPFCISFAALLGVRTLCNMIERLIVDHRMRTRPIRGGYLLNGHIVDCSPYRDAWNPLRSDDEDSEDEEDLENDSCDIPPSGWKCSRPKGREGPCAATTIFATGRPE